jgi:hypothetical protein
MALCFDQPLDDIGKALARPAHGAQAGDHVWRKPHVLLAALVGLVLLAHAAQRERGGDVPERRPSGSREAHGSGRVARQRPQWALRPAALRAI